MSKKWDLLSLHFLPGSEKFVCEFEANLYCRIYNLIYNDFQQALMLAVLNKPPEQHTEIKQKLQLEYRNSFGGRIWRITTGGAPTSPGVVQFLKE